MSDVGRLPMGRHQRRLRGKSERRARFPRLEQFLGGRPRRCGKRQRHRHGHAEHFHRRPRTGEGLGNGGVYLESLKAVAIIDGCATSCSLSRVFKILIIQKNRPSADHPFHVSQLYFIPDQLETLFIIQHVRERITRRHVQPIFV